MINRRSHHRPRRRHGQATVPTDRQPAAGLAYADGGMSDEIRTVSSASLAQRRIVQTLGRLAKLLIWLWRWLMRALIPKNPSSNEQAARTPTLDAEGSTDPVPSSSDVMFPAEVQRLQDRLKAAHKKNIIKTGHGMPAAGEEKPVDDVFVNLMVLPQPCSLREEFQENADFGSSRDLERLEHVFAKDARETVSVDIRDVFNVEISENMRKLGRSIRVLALASGGCGGTTVFLKYAPQQWARGEMWQQFTFVVAREFRSVDVQRAEDTAELLGLKEHDMSSSERRRTAVVDYVHKHPEKVCLILDGMDEVNLDDCSPFLRKVVRGEALQGIHLLVTSRPSSQVFDVCESAPFNRQVEVVGFNDDEMCRYVRKVLPADLAEKLLHAVHIEENGFVASMMATPFYTTAICELYQFNQSLPKCLTDVLESMILLVLSRSMPPGQYVANWDSIPPALKAHLNKIGAFAGQMLFRGQVIFSSKEITEAGVSEEAMRLGFLVSCDLTPRDRTRQFRFSHLALQEALASKFLSGCSFVDTAAVQWLVRQIGSMTRHLSTFWVLLAADLDDDESAMLISEVLASGIEGPVVDGASAEVVRAVTDQFFTTHSMVMAWHRLLLSHIRREQMEELAVALLEGLVDGDASTVVANRVPQGSACPDKAYLKELLLLWRHVEPLADGQLLVKALEAVDASVALNCREELAPTPMWERENRGALDGGIPVADTDASSGAKKQATLLAFRCFAERALHLEGMECTPTDLTCLASDLEDNGLDFSYESLSPADSRAISKVLEYSIAQVTRIYLVGCNLDTNRLRVLSTGLQACRNVSTADFRDNTLSSSSTPLLAEVITAWSPWLTEFDMALNENIGDDGMDTLQHALVKCDKLSTLDVWKCGLTASCVPSLGAIVTNCGQLERVNVGSNAIGDTGLAQLQPALCSHRDQLQSLELDGCSITSECCGSLNIVLQHQQHSLRKLDLENNDIGNDGVLAMVDGLCKCTSMEVVDMSRNNLSAELLHVMCDILQHWPILKELHMYNQKGNEHSTVDVDVAVKKEFVAAVSACVELTFLQIPWHWVSVDGEELPGLRRDGLLVIRS